MSKIAVLLPVYKNDNPLYFTSAIASVIKQTNKNFKIFVGVDGPITGELEDAVRECQHSSTFCICRYEANRGLACVLNDLIVEAEKQGFEYFARMDADDVCVNNRFEIQLDYLLKHAEVDVVGGAIEEIDDQSEKNGKKVIYPLNHKECRKFFRYRDPLAHPATFFRKSYFDKVAKYNGKVNTWYRPEYRKNQDTMLWFDGFMSGCIFANLPDTVLNFRVAKDFYERRNGWKRAKHMLRARMELNKAMKSDVSANLFALAMAIMTVSPTWLKKFLYKIR